MHWGGDFGMGYGMGGGFGGIFMLLFWVLVILALYYLVKNLTGKGKSEAEKETPEDVLKKRFAKGEMSKEELEEALQVLKKHKE
jgi:putative membrane protein